MFKNTIFKAGLMVAMVTAAHSAGAGTIYTVSSTPTVNCGTSSHGLWTNSYNSGSCGQYYDFQAGSTLEVDETRAALNATADNGAGSIATISIIFEGFEDTYDHYKNGGTPNYNGTDNPVDWDFYTFITSGTISFSSGDLFSILLVGQPNSLPHEASADKPVLQIGDGANDKSAGFGASAWLDAYDITPTSGAQTFSTTPGASLFGGHWDLNMSLVEEPPGGSEIPIPGTLALLGLGFAGLGWSRRKQRS